MPTFNDPGADADGLREAVRGLAHATRAIEDPISIYPVLGSISSALASLSQSLHQLGEFHDGTTRRHAWINGDPDAGRAASYREFGELHRAAEMRRSPVRPGAKSSEPGPGQQPYGESGGQAD